MTAPAADPPPTMPPLTPEQAAALDLEDLRKSGARLFVVTWDGHAYTVRPVGHGRRRAGVIDLAQKQP